MNLYFYEAAYVYILLEQRVFLYLHGVAVYLCSHGAAVVSITLEQRVYGAACVYILTVQRCVYIIIMKQKCVYIFKQSIYIRLEQRVFIFFWSSVFLYSRESAMCLYNNTWSNSIIKFLLSSVFYILME